MGWCSLFAICHLDLVVLYGISDPFWGTSGFIYEKGNTHPQTIALK